MSEEQQQGGGVFHVGQVSGGAVSFGAHSQAHYHEGAKGPQPDETTAKLLEAVSALKRDLAALAASEATQEAGRELAETEREIAGTGRVTPDRLHRLGELLAPGASAVGLLASAATVAQVVAQLLG
ncbi:hypothetical protein ACH429_08190 [Streptomyces pathocidini]|uniref:Uncharacterized protein n=1 Tax=Streptomyces pathocidini TaxID=1650571 RepID=A0ABW7UN80_9ACTN|nr:hypothetical protein [Streptomyces pathocidini]